MIEMIAVILDPAVRYGFPSAAFVLSFASFFISMRNWRESNRPIVAAAVRTNRAGNEAITYDLVVINAGNRPACRVMVKADLTEVAACLEDAAGAEGDNAMWSGVRLSLSGERHIPLLLHGKEAVNSFGYTGDGGGKGSFWRYGCAFRVHISYFDLTGRQYSSRQVLEIRDTEGFAGSKWSAPAR